MDIGCLFCGVLEVEWMGLIDWVMCFLMMSWCVGWVKLGVCCDMVCWGVVLMDGGCLDGCLCVLNGI